MRVIRRQDWLLQDHKSGVRRGVPPMKRRWILLALLAAFLSAPRVGLAEDLDSKQLIGSWKGTTPSPASGNDYWELCLRDNGTLSGDLQSVRGGLLNVSGTYKIAGDTLEVQGNT